MEGLISNRFIHGGAYRHPPIAPTYECSPRAGLTLLSALHEKFPNVRLASLGYRLLRHPRLGCVEPPVSNWKECLADVESGVRALGLDQNGGKVILVGHSVGAFLAGKVRGVVRGVTKVIGVEGCYDFVDLVDEYGDDAQWVIDAMGPKEEVPGEWKVDADVKIWSSEDELLSVRQMELGDSRKITLQSGSHDGVLDTADFVEAISQVVDGWLKE